MIGVLKNRVDRLPSLLTAIRRTAQPLRREAAEASPRRPERSIRLRGQDFVPSHLARQQAAHGHVEHLSQKHQLEVCDPADPQLDAGNNVAGNIPAGQLTLRRQHGLRPSPAGAQHANLRADNVTGFLGGSGHVVWVSTLDLNQLSQSDRAAFHTMSAQLRRPLQRSAAFVRRTSCPERNILTMKSVPREATVPIEDPFGEIDGNSRDSVDANDPAPAIMRWVRRYINFLGLTREDRHPNFLFDQ